MPQRPRQHEIDSLADQVLRESLPPSWVVNRLDPDYSKDFLVEVVDGGDVTGKVFVVQLKGKERLRKRRDGKTSVSIEREHLRYYLEKLQLPLFLVAADVGTREAFFRFAQRAVEEDTSLQQRLSAPGRATFLLSTTDRVRDTSRLLCEIDRAWEFMREKYPGSVNAAVQAKIKKLRRLDDRFDYKVTLLDGRENIELQPKQEVPINISIKGEPAKVAAFFDEGQAFAIGPSEAISIEGSPVFASGGRITSAAFTPQRPVEVELFVEGSRRGRVALPEYRGNLGGGFRKHYFHGDLPRSPLKLDLMLEPKGDRSVHASVTWKWDVGTWVGQNLALLPWLDQVKAFLEALAEPEITLGIRISTRGIVLLDGPLPTVEAITKLAQTRHFVGLVFRAREVCRVLNLPAVMPKEWKDQDFADVEEVYALVTQGRYQHPDRYDFAATVEGLAPESQAALTGADRRISLRRESMFDFLGVSFDFSDTETELSDWREIKIEPVAGQSSTATRIELTGCLKTVHWPRFRREPAKDEGVADDSTVDQAANKPSSRVRSPRLAQPEQARDFRKQIVEVRIDAGL